MFKFEPAAPVSEHHNQPPKPSYGRLDPDTDKMKTGPKDRPGVGGKQNLIRPGLDSGNRPTGRYTLDSLTKIS